MAPTLASPHVWYKAKVNMCHYKHKNHSSRKKVEFQLCALFYQVMYFKPFIEWLSCHRIVGVSSRFIDFRCLCLFMQASECIQECVRSL